MVFFFGVIVYTTYSRKFKEEAADVISSIQKQIEDSITG
jgi:hypothetical protein